MARIRNLGDPVVLNNNQSDDSTKRRNIGEAIVLQNKTQSKSLLSAAYIDNGKLRIDKNQVAQSKGFSSNAEQEAFKTNKPELYEAMGGVNYFPQSAPVTDINKINLSNEAVNKIVNRFSNTNTNEIDGIVKILSSDKWQNADTMKKYSDKINSYANDYIALTELGYFNQVSEDERKKGLDNIKKIKDFVNAKKDLYAWYGNKERFDYLKDVVVLPRDEQLQIVRDWWSANNIYKSTKKDIELLQESIAKSPQPENTENVDEYTDFLVDWYKKNNTITGAREAYGISKGYVYSSGKYAKEKEKSSALLDKAESMAMLEIKFGDAEYVKKRNEKLQEYWENTNLTKEFEKYYNEMNADAKADEYIAKGRKIYKTKNKNISNEEYDVTCYYLGKGQKNNYYFTWLKDAVYKREVAASGGWSAVTDGESLKYHRLWSDYTKDAPLEANVTSVALNLGSGIEFAYNTLNGEVKESKLSKASSKIRESYSNTHDWNILGFDAHDFLYNATMSGIDSFAATALGGTSKISGAMLGLSAAAAGVNDALKRGMSDEQAFWNGLMSGAFECFFETCSIEKFKKLQQSAGATFKNAIKNLAKSMLTNASEEALTEIANITYDIVANGDLSHYHLTIQRYMDSGLSESQAKGKAIKQLAGQVLEATASGAFIGLGFGSVGNISSAFNAYAYGKSYYGWSQKSTNALIGNGLAMPEGSEAYKLAVKAEGKLKSDKNVSGGALYNLATAIKSEIENKSVDRFNEYGVNKKTAKELSPVVAKAVFGEQLTSQEHETLKNNKMAAQVVNELSADRANTIWKDAIKSRSVNFSASSNKNAILHLENNDNIINTIDDDYVDEKANAKDIEKTSQIDVLSNVSGESRRTDNESYENKALNELELTAILNYKSSASYIINDVLRNSENLSDAETEFVRNMDDALIKMPTYQGAVYRNIAFDWFGGQEAYDAFLNEHKIHDFVTYLAYTSASTKVDGYLVDGHFAVSMVLESRSAKNVDGCGNNFESEVIFPRNSVFLVNNVEYSDKGQPIIYMTEVIDNDEGKHGQFYPKERSEAVQSLQKSISWKRKSKLQDISDDNTTRRLDRKNYLQRVSGNERGLNYFDYTITEKLRENFEDKVELRFLELGVDKKAAKELSPVVAKAVFGEQLTSQEHETLKNNKMAAQVVNELSADRANTIWKDAIKNNNVNFYDYANKNNILLSENNDNIINTVGDDYVDEKANAKDIEKTSQIDVLSNVSGESRRTDNESYENKALNELELTAILNYKSSASYKINDTLRNFENLSDVDVNFVKNMDSALIKIPTYQGTVYRNITFDWFGGQAAYDAFLSEHKVGYVVDYSAFTSASIKEDGYLVDGRFAVSMVLESRSAKNVDGYGNNFESEVIFPRNSVFVVNDVKYNDIGQPIIYMTEVIKNDEGKHGQFYSKERSEAVQLLSKSQPRYSDLQDISDDNTTRCYDRKNYLQSVSEEERGLKEFDYEEIEKLKEGFKDKVESRLLELGVDKKVAKELSPVVAKAVFGEQLSSQEHETLKNNKMAAQVVKELSADRANTVWKDAIKNSRTNNVAENNAVTKQGEVLKSTADGVVDSEKDLNYNDNNINKGENYNGEDTKLLGRGAVPAADTRDNILWESGTNSETLAECLGIYQNNNRIYDKRIWAGESNWLVKRAITTGEKTRKSFKESVYRRIRGVSLSGKDTIGGVVGQEILEKFKNTICKDENGNLISLYHWTAEVFEEFTKGEFGFHFGTLSASKERYLQLKDDNPNISKGVYKEVILNITNPIEIIDENGIWTAGWVAFQIYQKGVITESEYERVRTMSGIEDLNYDNPAAKTVREILAQNGYDGIIYENLSEDVGSYSLIALYPEQIITVAENGVLKENSGINRTILEGKTDLKYNESNIKEGENYGSKDTKLLERGAVPAAYTRDNILWESSTNSEALAACLGVSQRGDTTLRKTIRAGECSWLDEKPNPSSQKTRKSFKESVYRRIRGIKLSGKDTIGGTVSTEILEGFKNTICKDEKGNLISLYHWTSEIFETFKKGEFGFHFGTLRAANDRYLQMKEDNPSTAEGIFKEVICNISNPIELKDGDVWTAGWVAIQLYEKGIIGEQQYSSLFNIDGFYDNTYDNPAAKAVREILAQNGYDGIIYENLSEDVGSYSLIALYPEQIVTVAENGVLKENSGIIRAIPEKGIASFSFAEQKGNGIDADELIKGLSEEKNKLVFSEEYIDELLESFGITKPGDYIHVQKCVMETLEREGFFTDKENRCTKVVNDASGMIVEINKSGIDETFNLHNYSRVGRNIKFLKLSVIRQLPEIIKYGELIKDDVKNAHEGTAINKKFAYIRHTISVDGKAITVQLDIKKSPQKNKFWVHKIIKNNSANSFPASNEIDAEAGQRTVDTINVGTNTQSDNVKAIKADNKVSTYEKSLSHNYLNVNVNNNKHNNGIDADEFIKGLHGEDSNSLYEQGEVLQSTADGVVEEIQDARNLTDEQAVEYLKQAKRGELFGHSYIPIRKDTPATIIDTLGAVGIEVQDCSLIMQVRKAQQAMSVTNNGSKSKKQGNNIRNHGMSAEQIVEIVNNLDHPTAMILQTNRYNQYGEELPDNVAVFVEYNANGKEGVAIVEFDSSIDPQFIGKEYGDTDYHTVVTIFEPDIERGGIPFDYIEELLSNPDNYELEIVRRQPARSATGEKHPNTSSELPSPDIISAENDNVKHNGRQPARSAIGKKRPNTSSELPSSDIIFDDLDNVNNNYATKNDIFDGLEELNSREIADIENVCTQLGRKVVFEDLRDMLYKGEIISPDGYIDAYDAIHINTYAENPLGFVFKHELTHFGEKSSRYIEFVKTVKKSKLYKKWITEKTGESDLRIAEYKYKQAVANAHSDIYGAADPKADAEMIADFVGDMLFTENGRGMVALTSDLDTKQRNAVIQFVLDFISFLKKKLSGIDAMTFELSRMEDRFNELLFDAKNNDSIYDNEVKFSIKQSFYTQLDNWDKETIGFSFVVGTTSDALLSAGVPNKQIRWDASKIRTLLNKHIGMDIEIVRQIPNLLENPIVVIDSKQNHNSRIVMGELSDNNGKLVTVVILLTPTSKKGNQLDVIKISSAQGRGHIESLFKKDDGGFVKIWYIDKERIQSWLNVNRLQLPLHSFNLDSNSIVSNFSTKVNENNDGFNKLLSDAKNNDGVYGNEVCFCFGVTQEDINNYVDSAYSKENTEDYKKYAIPTQRLINDVADEIDISDYSHALRDNDIRHIKNSHGENTNEKYPVTSDDIKLIPWIVQNYDKVFVVNRDDNRTGIIYVKVNEKGLLYFLEQVTTIYGNEPLLVNKQMIKTGIDDIPNLKGLIDAINKKQSKIEFLADLKKVHEVYAQSVNQSYFNSSITKIGDEVNNISATNTDTFDDVRFNLKIKHADSTVEEIKDARNLTDEQAIEYLKRAKRGELRRETYIPIRKDTPATIIDTLSAVGIEVQDRSLIMQVRKVQQAMSATNNGSKSKKQGNNLRSHGMSAEQIVEIVNNLDNPTAIILQTNRYNQYGEELPDNVAVFVEYNANGKEGVAIVEFDSSIDPQFIGKEYGDTDYHTVVTIFEPDIERGGMPFDYIEELLSNPDNYELEIVRRQPTRSATQEKHPNTSSELPSSDIIFDELDNVNNNDSTKTDILDKLLDNKIKNTDKSDDFKFSISKTKNMDWIYQIYGLYNKKGQISRSDTLVVEIETPLYLRFDGIKNLPLAIPLSVVTKATNGKDQSHSIKQENIIKLQNGIRNADIVIKNPERNSFVFLTNIKQDGYPILVSFLQDVDFDGDRVHKATSIHLQIDVKSMLEALPSDATVYFKNKKEFNDMVGVTNNLRSLAANIEFIDEILSQNRGIVNNDYSTKNDIFDGLEELNSREIDEIESVCNRLGHKVVFEDLREMKYKGEIISPEGYIDQNDVIHINIYAENPLGFVFKHELTHYAENSDGYKTFVNAVKNSSLYAEWIKSKTGKEYSWDAEEAYRQMVYESQSNFKSIYDKKIDKEIIADFVGDMLFTYNGSGLLSIVIESTPKQRNVIVQWVLDFISHIKQILGGQKTYRALELSVLEDSFRCLLNDNSTFKQNAARDQYIDDDDIKFCLIRCTDNEVIKAAEDMEKTGAKQYQIWDKFKVIRDGWGDWLCEVDIRNFAFFAKGTASVERGQRNPKIKLDGNIIEGKLGDFVRFKSLFKLYPQLKEVEVVIKYAATDYDTAKYLIDSNKLIIDKKLYDNFVNKNDYTIKAHIIREIQRMVQVVEERNIDSRLKNIERIRQEGFPLSLTEDRMLTEKEIADNFADMYEARVVEKRQKIKNLMGYKGKKHVDQIENAILYKPNFNYDEILLFDDDNKLVTAKDYDVLNERHKLDNYNSIIYNSKIDTHRLIDKIANIKPYVLDAKIEQEKLKESVKKNSEKMQYYILDSSYQNRSRRTKTDVRIRAGNSGYLDASKKTVSQRYRSVVSQIYPDTDVDLSGEDTVGRTLSNRLIRQIEGTRFKDKYGNVLSFYMWNNTPVDINKIIKFGVEFTTFDGVLDQFLQEKQIRPYRYNGMFQEFYLKSVSPLVLDMNGWNTIDIAKRLLNENIITQSTFDSVMSRKTVTQTNLNNGTVQHLLDKIQIAGYDSIVFVKENGQSSVMVFKAQQIIPVAQKGIICNDEQISQTDEDVEYEKEICNVKFVAIDEQGKDSIAINDVRKQLLNCTDNTRKLIALTEILTGANQYIPEKKSNVLVGSSGIVGDINNNVWEALSKCEFLRARDMLTVADYDTAGRRVESEQKRNNALTIFKDNNGRLLSLFAYKGRYAHDQFGIQLGTLDAARGIYNAQKENHHTIMYNNFLEYYVNMTNPYFFVTNSKEITPAALAKSLFAEDKITFDEYSQLLATNGCKTTSAKSPAAAYLKRVMWRKGIDGVIYMDNLYDIGTMGVIALYTTQLTPVSENGKEVSNNILSKADANESAFLMHKNNVEKINKELLDGAKVGKYNKNIVGLTLEQKQRIKEKTGWSDTIIDVIRSMEEAQIYIDAGLAEKEVNGRICLIRNDIDMDQVDKNGMTNRERIKHNKSPKNIYGEKVELHHICQRNDGPLAELTRMEHHQNGNDTILHDKKKSSEIDRIKFNPKRRAHWQIRFEI